MAARTLIYELRRLYVTYRQDGSWYLPFRTHDVHQDGKYISLSRIRSLQAKGWIKLREIGTWWWQLTLSPAGEEALKKLDLQHYSAAPLASLVSKGSR